MTSYLEIFLYTDLYFIPHTSLYSPDDALIVRNMYIEILWVFICEMWPSIPIVSVKALAAKDFETKSSFCRRIGSSSRWEGVLPFPLKLVELLTFRNYPIGTRAGELWRHTTMRGVTIERGINANVGLVWQIKIANDPSQLDRRRQIRFNGLG